ncbi:hypothetical protein DV736_g6650, partial [Chaetothyriales sp. CBS 134916]
MVAAGQSHIFCLGSVAFLFTLLIFSVFYGQPLHERLRPPFTRPNEHQPAPSTNNDDVIQEELKEYGEDVTSQLSQEYQDAAAKIVNTPKLNIVSKITSNGEYLRVDWRGHHRAYNPSIVPHPYKKDTWILIGQKDLSREDFSYFSVQLVCEAQIHGDTMRCILPPLSLPIAPTVSHYCTAEGMNVTKDMIGPHDARLFHGIDSPMLSWISQSQYTCFGQYFQDLRRLVAWDSKPYANEDEEFFWPTEVRTPIKPRSIEKNYFLFWDVDGQAFAHQETKRDHRTFAKLNTTDGMVGENLAPFAAEHDARCLAQLMPEINLETKLEYIHQSTNSLLVTLCKRSDPHCQRTTENTFVFFLFNKKSFYMHGMYEPYIMLFKQTSPFEVYAVSQKSLWYNGRGRPEGEWQKDTWRPHGQTELLFTTSMSWKSQALTYHGFLDDTLFLTFGIEDKRGGIIDVIVGDLIADLAYCDRSTVLH